MPIKSTKKKPVKGKAPAISRAASGLKVKTEVKAGPPPITIKH